MRFLKSAILLSLIFSAHLLNADEPGDAWHKESILWENVLATSYAGALPEIDSAGLWQSTSLLNADYLSKALTHSGDVMIEGREKLIHRFGTTVTVAFVPTTDNGFTGLFSAGAPSGLMRVSFAFPASSDNPPVLVPGLAMKFFIDGKASVNFMAMPFLDGQTESNIFHHTYTTSVPKPAWSIKTTVGEERFASALSHVGNANGNPRSLSLAALAAVTSTGQAVEKPIAPFELVLSPSAELKALTSKAGEFRVQLEGHGEGLVLFEVLGKATVNASPVVIGKILAKSNFVASSFGDQKLFFKHPHAHTYAESDDLKPEL